MVNRNSDIFVGCLIAALIATACAADSTNKKIIVDVEPSNRMINGDIITIDQAPYMIQVKYNNKYLCGGTLISTQHVLTAAHCLKEKIAKDLTAVGGASLRTDAGVVRQVVRVFRHPSYIPTSSDFDVAVLKLKQPFVEGNTIKAKTELCSAPPAVGEFIKLTGWGATKMALESSQLTAEDRSNELRLIRLPIISNDECRRKTQAYGDELTKRMICAYDGSHATFIGDSGGPGVYGNKLCAIISWSLGSRGRLYPAMYTSVAAVRDFIQKKLKL